jgi:O-antigen ligase
MNTEKSEIPGLLKWMFVLVLFVIPFESVQTSFTSGSFTVTKWAGWMFLIVAALFPRISFRRSSYVIWLFVLYLFIYLFFGLFQNPIFVPYMFERSFTILQMIIFMWIAQNLLRDRPTSHLVLFSLGASATLISLLQIAGITSVAYDGMQSRMTALGEDPNSFAAVLALGFLSLLGLAFFSPVKLKALRIAAVPMLGLIMVVIIRTGSRGGMLGVLCGMLILMLDTQSSRSVITNIAIVSIAIFALYTAVSSDSSAWSRLRLSVEKGSLADREKIMPMAWKMIQERPVSGWGPYANYAELGRRLNRPTRDTHNLFLLILTEVGLIGAIPYFLAIAGTAQKAWTARAKLHNILPLMLLACLFVVNMALSWHNRKLHWFVLAYCIASVPFSYMAHKKRTL